MDKWMDGQIELEYSKKDYLFKQKGMLLKELLVAM